MYNACMSEDTYVDYVLGQLQAFSSVNARKMFGGYGLFKEKVMFGLITKEAVLYFRVDIQTQVKYENEGMVQFKPFSDKAGMPYFTVPEEVIESDEVLCAWAKEAYAVAVRAKK